MPDAPGLVFRQETHRAGMAMLGVAVAEAEQVAEAEVEI